MESKRAERRRVCTIKHEVSKMILMIDNYDSFTYNLVQYLGQLGEELIVKRNDEVTVAQIEQLQPHF